MPWGYVAGAVVGAVLAPDAPETPDYVGAAKQQGNDNVLAAQVQGQMNRVNTTTPYGSQTFNTIADPSVPGGFRYTSDITLSPQQQQLYDTQTRLGNAQLGRVENSFASPFNFGQYGNSQRAGQATRLRDVNGDVYFKQEREKLGAGPQFERAGAQPNFSTLGQARGQSYDTDFDMVGMGGRPQFSEMGAGPQMGRVSGQGPQARDLYGKQGYEQSRGAVENALMRRYERLRSGQMAEESGALESKLKNMGLTEGTEAYDRELAHQRQSQGQERADWADRAILAGGNEQSRLAGLDLSADAQRFGQQQQGFQNEFSRTEFNNSAAQQEFSNEGQRLGSNNASRQAGFGNELAAANQRNQARSTGNEWQRTGANDLFGQQKDVAGLNNQTEQQVFADSQTARMFNNEAAQREYGNEATRAVFNNTAYDQEYQRYMQALGYQENSDMTRAVFNNTARTNDINEGLMARNMPLQEYNTLRTGTNPTLPQFQPYGMNSVAPGNGYNAAVQQGQANQQAYNQQIGNYQQYFNMAAQAPWSQMQTPSWMSGGGSAWSGQSGVSGMDVGFHGSGA